MQLKGRIQILLKGSSVRWIVLSYRKENSVWQRNWMLYKNVHLQNRREGIIVVAKIVSVLTPHVLLGLIFELC